MDGQEGAGNGGLSGASPGPHAAVAGGTTSGGRDRRPAHNTLAGHAVVHGSVVQAERIESLTVVPREAGPLPVPRQLPVATVPFVNRTAELSGLTSALEANRLVAVSGLGGVGKTQLVARWAEEVAERFPDGQLYADLEDGRRDGAVDVSAVLADFLVALGAGDRMPATPASRAALFRTATAGRRLLIVLDNVQHAPEARPLFPGPGGARLLVLSRRRLPSLVLDGAAELTVDPLDERAGTELVRCWRHDAAEGTAERLVRLCGGLPLALRAAGHRIVSRSHLTLEDAVRELDAAEGPDAGGARWSVDDEVPAEAVFDRAVRELPDAARELYETLGCYPGTTFTREAVEAAGAPGGPEAIGELLTAHLALRHASPRDPEVSRFRLHDVVRAHARRHAREHVPAERRTAALRGFVGFCVTRAAHADHATFGSRLRLQPDPAGTCPFTGRAQALEWLEAERSNLLAVLRAAAELGEHDAVWQLCESLWALYHSRKHYSDWIESHRLGITAAQWSARPDAEIRMRNQLARAHYELGEWERAGAEIAPAEELLPLVDERRLHGVVWETRGLIALGTGRAEESAELFTRALRANEGDAHGVVVQSYNLAQALVGCGRAGEALTVLDEAMAGAADDALMQMRAQLVRARAHRAGGDADAAVVCAVDAAVRAAELGQYAKLEQALDLTTELADEVSDDRLRRSGLEQAARLREAVAADAGREKDGGRGGPRAR